MNRGRVMINDVDINLNDLDIKQLTKESQKDIMNLTRLTEAVENMTGNLTMIDVNEIDKNFSMRPTLISNSSQNRAITNL